jgi:hypothetical protein
MKTDAPATDGRSRLLDASLHVIRAKDVAEAKRLYAPRARWSAEGLALHIQASIQGAFILAKSSQQPHVAVDSMKHLRRYLETLFDQPSNKGD